MDPKTYGIWMGTQILRGKDKQGKPYCLVLLDSEGIGKTEKNHMLNLGWSPIIRKRPETHI